MQYAIVLALSVSTDIDSDRAEFEVYRKAEMAKIEAAWQAIEKERDRIDALLMRLAFPVEKRKPVVSIPRRANELIQSGTRWQKNTPRPKRRPGNYMKTTKPR